MAVWKKEKKPKKSSKKTAKLPGNIPAPVAIIAVLVIVGLFMFTSPSAQETPLPTLTITTSEQPGAIGFHQIHVSSDQPLETISVLVANKPVSLISTSDGMSMTFEFFVSPYDKVGMKPIVVNVVDTEGRSVTNDDKGFYVGYNAVGEDVLDVIYYTYEKSGYTPVEMAQRVIFEDNKTLNLFYELVAEGEYNTPSIQAVVPLIQNMSFIATMQNKSFNLYVVTVEGRDWVNCIDSEAAEMPLEDCTRILDEENSIIMRYPYYPTGHVFVTNTTVDVQPAPATQPYLVESMLDVVNMMYMKASLPLLPEVVTGNETSANETSL